MVANSLSLCSVSWIDEKPLPQVGFWFVAGAAISWPRRVVMGLVGTANPEPPREMPLVDPFRARKQYRALTSFKLVRQPKPAIAEAVLDPGWTPPFDKSKFDTRLIALAPIPDDPQFYPGETSGLSTIVGGRLHPYSTLKPARGDEVLASAFIKFRAGPHTDAIGVGDDVKSPVHVPWVWCEYALVISGSKARLLAQGSRFPSHAWYVGGRQVAKRYQDAVTVSEKDPAIATGQPAGHPQLAAAADRSAGSAANHEFTLDPGVPVEVDVTSLLV